MGASWALSPSCTAQTAGKRPGGRKAVKIFPEGDVWVLTRLCGGYRVVGRARCLSSLTWRAVARYPGHMGSLPAGVLTSGPPCLPLHSERLSSSASPALRGWAVAVTKQRLGASDRGPSESFSEQTRRSPRLAGHGMLLPAPRVLCPPVVFLPRFLPPSLPCGCPTLIQLPHPNPGSLF